MIILETRSSKGLSSWSSMIRLQHVDELTPGVLAGRIRLNSAVKSLPVLEWGPT